MRPSPRLRLVLLFAIASVACDDVSSPDGSQPAALAGFGASEAAPVGRSFSLPEGVRFASPIRGYRDYAEEGCATDEPARGSGDLVTLCFELENTTSSTSEPRTIEVVFPERWVVVSDSRATQNGILLQKVVITILPGQRLVLPMHFFCVNDTRHASAPGDLYSPGPIVDAPTFVDLTTRLADRVLLPSGEFELQGPVWDLSSGEPLDAEDLAVIEALPVRF